MKLRDLCGAFGLSLLFMFIGSVATAALPTLSEMNEAHQWAAAKFLGKIEAQTPEVGLVVLANNDPVQQNRRNGKPLLLGKEQYDRGLYCHATSKVVVRLPGPGKTFSAVAGVDSNDDTRGRAASVVFSVSVGEKQVFQSELMRENSKAIPVEVALDGATEFVLEVSDGGDGISCDQADWADAKVVLADGKTEWLGDMPIISSVKEPYDLEPFFSFKYDGKPSSEFLKTWTFERSQKKLGDQVTEHTLTYKDPQTGLVLTCVGIAYHDFPTVEWTLYFENTSDKNTPILSEIQAIDTQFKYTSGVNNGTNYCLHHHVGSPHQPNDYQPLETMLPPGTVKRITTSGGRSSYSDWPYFNLQRGGEGTIVVLGWPGQWAAQFENNAESDLRVCGGQELTHFYLEPGEKIRTPLVVLQFWKGDRIHAQNVWRRWMLDHNLPRPHGKLPPIQHVACSSHQYAEMCNADTQSQILFIDRYLEEGLKLEYWWMDAGWYPCDGSWPKTGTWEVDKTRFPNGLREISDHGRTKGVNTIVWFEPERVAGGTWLTETHPEWVFGGKNGGLLNLGDPEVLKWVTNHIDKIIVDEGIDFYRQDYNIDPLGFWRNNDTPDRQGITEIKYVTGYLAYWDELRRRHPAMLIDSCASGGKRNDLETLRRSIPLLRSDCIFHAAGNQGHTYGMSFWVPYQGTGTNAINSYDTRSAMCASVNTCWDLRNQDLNYDEARRLFKSWRQFAPYMVTGDYYPLTPYSLAEDQWIAWQFDCSDQGEGVVQAFRRPASIYEVARFRLSGLDSEAMYELTDHDVEGVTEMTGHDLMKNGLPVSIPDRPGAVVITYKKK